MDALTLFTLLRPGTVVRIARKSRRMRSWVHAECVLKGDDAWYLKHCLDVGWTLRIMPGRLPYTETCALCCSHACEADNKPPLKPF